MIGRNPAKEFHGIIQRQIQRPSPPQNVNKSVFLEKSVENKSVKIEFSSLYLQFNFFSELSLVT